MLVCHCMGVNDSEVRALVAEGCQNLEDVTLRCGAGGRCGGCVPHLEEYLPAETAVALTPA